MRLPPVGICDSHIDGLLIRPAAYSSGETEQARTAHLPHFSIQHPTNHRRGHRQGLTPPIIQTRQPYDAYLHARNQKLHGSWVLDLIKPVSKVG